MPEFEALVKTARALSDSGRMRIVLVLRHGELSPCQLVRLLGLAPSTVSRHLSLLKDAGLVSMRREGRWIHYFRPEDPPDFIREALEWVDHHATTSPQMEDDLKKVNNIRMIGREQLCASVEESTDAKEE